MGCLSLKVFDKSDPKRVQTNSSALTLNSMIILIMFETVSDSDMAELIILSRNIDNAFKQ